MSRENASARPPSDHELIELAAKRERNEGRQRRKGNREKHRTVARMLPRNSRIIRDVSNIPIPPSSSRFSIAVFTNTD